jgi:hypothetical protein
MVDDLSSEMTAILAIYSTRRDAEMAQDRLDEEGVQAFITADDAGGMHPQLQQSHGVKLVVLERAAQYAQGVLDDAGLLPHHYEPPAEADEGSSPEHVAPDEDLTFSTERSVFITAAVVVLVVLGLIGAG